MENEKLVSLVQRAQQGNAEAMDELFTEFYNDVYYFALKTVKDSDIACDITQEAFLEIIRTIGDLKEPSAFVTWMKQVTYHRCTRYFRAHKEVLVDEDEDGNSLFDTLADDGAMPAEVLEQEEFRKTILSMIDQLSEEQRAAVMLYYFDELTVGQIAQIQGVSEGTVKSRLNYARKSIKKSVEDYEKKHDIKLHSFALLPLLMLFFGKESMPKAAAAGVRTAVAQTIEGVAAAAGTTAATAATTSAAATAAAAAASSSSISGAAVAATTVKAVRTAKLVSKLAAIPMWGKAVSVALVATLSVGAAVVVSNPPAPEPDIPVIETTAPTALPTEPTVEPTAEPTTEPSTEPAVEYAAGTFVVGADGIARLYGENNTITNTYTWDNIDYGYAGAPWYNERANIIHVIIPNKISHIGRYAFLNCFNLTSVTIGNGITSIGNFAFDYCNKLAAVYISDVAAWCQIDFGNDEANPLAFSKNLYLNGELVTDLVVPEGTTKIESSVFRNCTSLTNIVIPDSVTSIGDSAFYGCTSLTGITIPDSVTSVGDSAFYRCKSLTSVTIGSGVASIGNDAFAGCSSLNNVTIGNSVTIIGDSAFFNCTNLTDITIPDSVRFIDMQAFYGCTSLTTITIPDSVTSIGDWAFWGCTGLNAITLGNGIGSIGKSAFRDCTSLITITIPDSVTSIGYYAFFDCTSLTSITIPYRVGTIAVSAFEDCDKLTSITFEGTIAQWQSMFKGHNWKHNVPATYVQCSDGTVAL